MKDYRVFAPECLGSILPGDDLLKQVSDALIAEQIHPQDGDILVLAHKIVSKAEGRVYPLSQVRPSPQALALARITEKEAALVELILRETDEVLWASKGLLLCRHRLGHICANAAVDCSNAGEGLAVLLPVDPDRSAAELRHGMESRFHCRLGVLICDTHGRPFREGAGGAVVGASGVRLLKSYVGRKDRDGRTMCSSVEATGDELASAATLLMGQGGESRPLALIRGLDALGNDTAAVMMRNAERDVLLSALRKLRRGDTYE